MGRPPGDRRDIAMKVSRAFRGQIQAIAVARGVSAAQLVDDLFGAQVTAEYARLLALGETPTD